jgi:ubiquitin C-terminal hydrolase
MEKILRQLRAVPEYSEGKKSEVIKNVVEKAPLPVVSSALDKLLDLTTEWLLSGETEGQVLGQVLLTKLVAKCGTECVGAWYTAERVVGFVVKRSLHDVVHAIDTVRVVSEVLAPLPTHWFDIIISISRYVELLLPSASQFPVTLQLSILRLLRSVTPKWAHVWPWPLSLLAATVRWLARLNIEVVGARIFQEMCDVSVFVLEAFAQHTEENEVMSVTVNALVSVLQQCDRVYVSDALVALLQHPLLLRLLEEQRFSAADAYRILTTYDGAAPLRVFTLFTRWPLVSGVVAWALLLYRACCTVAHATTLTVFVANIPVFASNVTMQLYVPALRVGALELLETLLLTHQHSPRAFHTVLPHLIQLLRHSPRKPGECVSATSFTEARCGVNEPPTLCSLASLVMELRGLYANATSASCRQVDVSEDFAARLASLVHTLLFCHPGYPELYAPLVTLLAPYPRPSQSAIRQRLKETLHCIESIKQPRSLQAEGDSEELRVEAIEDAAIRNPAGCCGLINLGNTCYMNSFLQALFFCDLFREAMLGTPLLGSVSGVVFGPKEAVHLSAQLQRLFVLLRYTQRPAVAPSALLRGLPPVWRTGHQQDASEFGHFLFDQLERAVKFQLRDGRLCSLPQLLFGGLAATIIRCQHCQRCSVRQENFVDLSVSLPSVVLSSSPSDKEPPTLQSLLASLWGPEYLTGPNRYWCDRCQSLQDAERRFVVTQSPRHLLFTLNRFAFDPNTHTRSKVLTEVKCPESLVLPVAPLSVVTTTAHAVSNTSTLQSSGSAAISPTQDITTSLNETPLSVPVRYSLYAAVIHSGYTAERGHYYTYARRSGSALSQWNSSLPTPASSSASLSPSRGESSLRTAVTLSPVGGTSEWLYLNDATVSLSSFAALDTLTQRFPSDVAYLLFYARVDNTEPPRGIHSCNDDAEVDVLLQLCAAATCLEKTSALLTEVTTDNQRYERQTQQQQPNTAYSPPFHVTFANSSSFSSSSSHYHDDGSNGNPDNNNENNADGNTSPFGFGNFNNRPIC